MKRLLSVLFSLTLLIYVFLPAFPAAASSPEGDEQWILYAKNAAAAQRFADSHPDRTDSRTGRMIKGRFSGESIAAFKTAGLIVGAEPNAAKSVSSSASFNDPKYPEQWALPAINFPYIAGKYSSYERNRLKDRASMETGGIDFPYSGQPFQAKTFSISLPEPEKLTRLSVKLQNNSKKWKLTVYSHNTVIGSNSTTYKQNDILLPKGKEYDSFRVEIELEGMPVIEQVTAVNHTMVALIDTGIIEHEDFCGNVLFSQGRNYTEERVGIKDLNGHGTHVAGIMAACPNNKIGITGAVGNAPVDILPYKALDKTGWGDDFALSMAVGDAMDAGADVINMSIAGKGRTLMLYQAIQKAISSGVTVVAAAGNWNISTEDVFPAGYPGVMTVSAVSQDKKKITTSNYGWEVDISAPGQQISGTYIHNDYTTMTGTSMAAPFVSSIAAVLKAEDRSLDSIEMRRLLEDTARPAGSAGYSPKTGAGVVRITGIPDKTGKIDWLTLKDGQPIKLKDKKLLGVSGKLIGQRLYVFCEETLSRQMTIDKHILDIPIKQTNKQLSSVPVTVIAAQADGTITDSYSIQLAPEQEVKARSFKDVRSKYWAYSQIMKAAGTGVVYGYGDHTFKPSNPISKRHGIMMMDRYFRWDLPGQVSSPFQDSRLSIKTPGFLAIISAAGQNVVRPDEEPIFYSERALTRGQMAIYLSRALGLDNRPAGSRYPYRDLEPGSELDMAVQQLAAKGIVVKQKDYRPNEKITRAQFAAMMMRIK